MTWWRRLVDWWYARRRALDLAILWPSLKRQAILHAPRECSYLAVARRGFALHMAGDPAWQHTRSWTGAQLKEFMEKNLN